MLLPVVFALSLAARGAERGTAEGELKVGATAVSLKHACALELDDVEGLRSPGTPQRTVVLLLTDVEPPARIVGNLARSVALTYSGRMRGVELRIDFAARKMVSGAVYFPLYKPPSGSVAVPASMGPVAFLPTDGAAGNYVLQELQLQNGQLAGTALMTRPQPWPQLFKGETPPPRFHYRVVFSAPVRKQPAVTAVLTAAAARRSPQARALFALDTALRKGDLGAARRCVTPEVRASWDHLIARWGAAEFKKVMAGSPDAATRSGQISRVVVRGEEARIVSQKPVRSDSVVRRNGRWLVDTP